MYSRCVIVMFYKKYFGLLKAKTINDRLLNILLSMDYFIELYQT